MKRSYYGHQNEVVPGRVSGYGKGEDGYKIAEYISMTQPYAAGSLMSTVDDLGVWARSGETLLKKESVERLHTPAKLTSGRSTKYAYGLGIADDGGTRIIEHGGDIFGFSTDLLRVPDQDLVVIVLSNNPGQEPGPEALAYRVARKALGRALEDRKGMALDPATLDDYVGVYRFDKDLTRKVVDAQIEFQRGADGKATGLTLLQGGEGDSGKEGEVGKNKTGGAHRGPPPVHRSGNPRERGGSLRQTLAPLLLQLAHDLFASLHGFALALDRGLLIVLPLPELRQDSGLLDFALEATERVLEALFFAHVHNGHSKLTSLSCRMCPEPGPGPSNLTQTSQKVKTADAGAIAHRGAGSASKSSS